MKLYSMKLYHGTPHDFDQFDTEHIGGGEGHQAHGWGLYFATERDVVAENYAKRLSKRNAYHLITVDGVEHKIRNLDNYDNVKTEIEGFPRLLSEAIDDNISLEDAVHDLEMELKVMESKDPQETIYLKNFSGKVEHYIRSLKYSLQYVREHNVQYKFESPKPVIFTVEVPDDLFFIDEDEYINDELLQKIGYSSKEDKIEEIYNLIFKVLVEYLQERNLYSKVSEDENVYLTFKRFSHYIADELVNSDRENYRKKINNIFDDVYYLFGRNLSSIDWKDSTESIIQAVENVNLNFVDIIKGKTFYNALSSIKGSPKEASLFLESHGVNGVKYLGLVDGRCYVIFNPNNVEIIKKEELNETV